MSADAFAAAVAKGVPLQRPRLRDAMGIGLVFGLVETVTPLLGWCLGVATSGLIASVDHWVAFIILCAIGLHMIWEGIHCDPDEPRRQKHSLPLLILTAIGTSIDALAVGVTLALINVNILIMSAMIGSATFLMATLGIMTGHLIGLKAGKAAELLAGLCLIAIGAAILLEHLGFLS